MERKAATTGRTAWLDAGLAVLAEMGAPSLRVDGLAARLKMTKGPFYHYFDGMPGYQRDLLEHFEQQSTNRFIEAVSADADLDARAKLDKLMELVLANREEALEVAVRAWAHQDRVAYAAQRRIDAIRVDYLRGLLEEAGCDGAQALEIARALYLLMIGAGHLVPPLSGPELRRLWEMTLATVRQV